MELSIKKKTTLKQKSMEQFHRNKSLKTIKKLCSCLYLYLFTDTTSQTPNRIKLNPSNMKSNSLLALAILAFYFNVNAQVVGGRDPGEITPQVMEPKPMAADNFTGNVNLFNGTYNSSYTLGSISTPGGLSFSLSLNYSSSNTIGNNTPISKGIPYGDGWSLNVPTISLSTDPYRKYTDAELQNFLAGQNPKSQVVDYDLNEGDLFWHSVNVNIPGKLNCRAVYKYSDTLGRKIFIPQNFDKYAEIILEYGDWIVILDDGTTYRFDLKKKGVRAPSFERAIGNGQNDVTLVSSGQLENQVLPKEEILQWYCTEISNRNIPGQKIGFGYKKFGKFNFFKEYQQASLFAKIDSEFGSEAKSKVTSSNLSCYRDILLTDVYSYDPFSTGDKLVLEYETIENPNGAQMLRLGDNGVQRLDSLYNYKTVYKAGDGQTSFINWKKYKHGGHDDLHPFGLSAPQGNVEPKINGNNPYIFDGKFNREFETGNVQNLSFDNSYLESPRINDLEDYIPGDLYEIKTIVSNSNTNNVGFLNLDINLATGPNSNSTATTVCAYGYNNLNAQTSVSGCPSGGLTTAPALESAFSTFSSAVKWNTRGEGTNTIHTSNVFSMPNLPIEYGGYYLQIGAANSDHIFNMTELEIEMVQSNGISRPSAYKAYDNVSSFSQSRPYYQSVPQNFGIGMPWYMMKGLYKNILDYDTDFTSNAFNFWFKVQHNNPSLVWPNQPTLANLASLNQVEIIRYSKNPYMLKSVKKLVASGEISSASDANHTLVSQVKMEYKIERSGILNNRDYAENELFDYNSRGVMQHFFLLSAIRNMPVDPSGSAASIDTTIVPTTFFDYTKVGIEKNESVHKNISGTFYVLNKTRNVLGKEQKIKYYDINKDTVAQSILYKRLFIEEQNWLNGLRAKGTNSAFQISALARSVEESINDTEKRKWIYEYSSHDKTGLPDQTLVPLAIHFDDRRGITGTGGFVQVKVYEPEQNGNRNYSVYEYYRKNDLSGDDKLMSGKLKKQSQYNYNDDLISSANYEYQVVKAYEGGFERKTDAHDQFDFDYQDYFEDLRPSPYVGASAFYAHQSFDGAYSLDEFYFYEEKYHDQLGQNSFFVPRIKETKTQYDISACVMDDSSPLIPTGDLTQSSGGNAYPGYINNTPEPEGEEFLNEILGAENYDEVRESITNNSPLSDNILTEILQREAFYEGIDYQELITLQDTLSDTILSLMLTEEQLRDRQVLNLYCSEFELPLSEFILYQSVDNSELIDISRLEVKLMEPDSLSDSLLLHILQKEPAFPRSMVKSILLNQPDLSESVMLNIFNDTIAFSGQQIESIFNNQNTFPTEVVLNRLVEEGNTSYPEKVLSILSNSTYALPSSTMQLIQNYEANFSPEGISQLNYFQSHSPALMSACSSMKQTTTVGIETISEYEYYDANEQGISTSNGYKELFGTNKNAVYLKYEPSWQLYSSKTHSPQFPNSFQEKRYYYYYDLKNRYDRYDFEYSTELRKNSSGGYDALEFDTVLTTNLPVELSIKKFFYNNNDTLFVDTINPDGLDRSYKNRVRNLPFQEKVIQQAHDNSAAHEQSTYYIFDSRWGDEGLPFYSISAVHVNQEDTCAVFPPPSSNACDNPIYYAKSNISIQMVFKNVILNGIPKTVRVPDTICANLPHHIFGLGVDLTVYRTGLKEDEATYFILPSYCNKTFGLDTNVFYKTAFQTGVTFQPDPDRIRPIWSMKEAALLSKTVVQIDTVLKRKESLEFKSLLNDGTENLSQITNDNFIYGESNLLDFYNSGQYGYYTVDYAEPLYPYDVLETSIVHERNIQTLPSLIENERGIKTRIVYDSMRLYKKYDSLCGYFLGYYYDVGNRHKPVSIISNSGDLDSLTIDYDYYPDLSIKSIYQRDNDVSSSYQYDAYGNLREEREEGRLINQYKVGFWSGDTLATFYERAAENYVEKIHFLNDSNEAAVIGREYVDPLGRAFHTVSGELLYGVNSDSVKEAIHSGQIIYNNRDQVVTQYKAFGHQDNGKGVDLNPKLVSTDLVNYPHVASNFSYEDTWQARQIKSAKVGQNIITGETVENEYQLLNSYCFSCELGLSNLELSLLMPEGVDKDYVFSKTLIRDEDDKIIESYQNALGQTVATRQFNDDGSSVTLTAYNHQGLPSTIINPLNQKTEYDYNIMGWMYRKETVDGGVTKYMFDESGNVVLMQDENARQGKFNVVKQSNQPYYQINRYDKLGRLTESGDAFLTEYDHFLPSTIKYSGVLDPLIYYDYELGDSTNQNNMPPYFFYEFTNNSTYSWKSKTRGWEYFQGTGEPWSLVGWHLQDIKVLDYLEPITARVAYNYDQYWTGDDLLSPNLQAILSNNHDKERLKSIVKYSDNDHYTERFEKQGQSGPLYRSIKQGITQITAFNYDKEGRITACLKQFNPNGIKDAGISIYYPLQSDFDKARNTTIGLSTVQFYSNYNNDGIWQTLDLDVNADGELDFQWHNEYDAWGRIKDSYANKHDLQENGNKIVSYEFDKVFGRLNQKELFYNYYGNHQSVDVINYSYDLRDRLLETQSDWFDYNLYYDQNQASLNSITPLGDYNYNGNINGIKAKYKMNGFANYTTGGLFDEATVANYKYDAMNRLIQTDAMVGDFLVGSNPTHDSYKMGDVTYTYDEAGNVTSLNRVVDNANSSQQFEYSYLGHTNRLTSVDNTSDNSTRNYTYDGSGNLKSDDSRNIVDIKYNAANQPYEMDKTLGEENYLSKYLYDEKGNRVYKQYSETKGNPIVIGEAAEYYLSDVSGRTIGILDLSSGKWEWFVNGIDRVAKIVLPNEEQPKFYPGNWWVSKDLPFEDGLANMDGFAQAVESYLQSEELGGVDIHLVSTFEEEEQTETWMLNSDFETFINNVPESVEYEVSATIQINSPDELLVYTDTNDISYISTLKGIVDAGSVDTLPDNTAAWLLKKDEQGELDFDWGTTSVNNHVEAINYYRYDHLGNTRLAYEASWDDATNQVEYELKGAYDYFAYGKLLRSFSPNGERYLTTQHERDQETEVIGFQGTGLDNRGARFYDSDVARFLSLDPAAAEYPSLSDYNYVLGNPILFIDRDGRRADWFQNDVTGQVSWIETSDEVEGFTHLGEHRYWNNVTSYGRWEYYNFLGRGNEFKAFINFLLADHSGHHDGANTGGTYGGQHGWENGGKQLFFGTIGTVASLGMISAETGFAALLYESFQLSLSVDDMTVAFFDKNETVLTKLGINQEDLEVLKTAASVADFTKGTYELIDEAVKNPDLPADALEMGSVLLSELEATMGIIDSQTSK